MKDNKGKKIILPELKTQKATIRKTKIGEDGKLYEVTEVIEVPIISRKNKGKKE